jgi:peptide/nickel transport system permease protein
VSSIWDLLRHLVLPASVLALAFAAPLSRYTRSAMINALRSEYVIAARAKGIANSAVILRHAFRNSLVLIVTVVGLAIPDLLAGAVIIEQVFSWPGMGQLAVSAAGNRDVPLMMGIVLVVGTTVVFANLVVDVLYGLIDPRIRLAR